MKALWMVFAIAVVAAVIVLAAAIFIIRVFFWFISDTFKRSRLNGDDIEAAWWDAIK